MLQIVLKAMDGSEEDPRVLAVVEPVGRTPDLQLLLSHWRQLYPEGQIEHEFGIWLDEKLGFTSPPFAVQVVKEPGPGAEAPPLPDAVPALEDAVLLRMPRAAWATLSETLQMDTQSTAFDKDLREEISKALETVTEVT